LIRREERQRRLKESEALKVQYELQQKEMKIQKKVAFVFILFFKYFILHFRAFAVGSRSTGAAKENGRP
jgi:hypothetical protein